MKPPIIAEVLTPDTIAECYLSLPKDDALYIKLWSVVEDYPDKRTPEEMESPDALMNNNLAQFWDRLDPEEQARIIEIDQENDDEEEGNEKTH